MSDYFNGRIYKIKFAEVLSRVDHAVLMDLLGFTIPEEFLDFSTFDGTVHGDYKENDFFDLPLIDTIDPDYFDTLTVEQQTKIQGITIGQILPPGVFLDSLYWVNPVNMLGAEYYEQTVAEAKAARTDFVLQEGNNIILGDNVENEILSGDGNDYISTYEGNDLVNGGNGDDYITTGDGADILIGGLGDDWLGGFDGNDILVGGVGDDWLEGGKDQDELYGGSGDDILNGNKGNDYISGGSGQDVVNGTEGDDFVMGGGGEDTVLGGTGDDTLIGEYYLEGQGWNYSYSADTYVMGYGWGNDIIKDFGYGNDVLDFRSFSFDSIEDALSYAEQVDSNVVFTFSDGSTLTLERTELLDLGADNIWIEGAKPTQDEALYNTMYGTSGADIIIATLPAQTIFGGDGSDEIYAIGGDDTIWGERGNDYIASGDGNDWVYGGTGNDTLNGNRGFDHIYGEEGDDTLYGNEGQDYLIGGEGADNLFGGSGHDIAAYYIQKTSITLDLQDRSNDTGEAVGDHFDSIEEFNLTLYDDTFNGSDDDDLVLGLEGNDTLKGNSGNDSLYGNEGDDTLIGGAGDDRIYTGSGADTIIFYEDDGYDEVYQFDVTEDVIYIDVSYVNGMEDLTFTTDGLNLNIDYASGNIVLHEVSLASLTEDNLVFA